MPAISDILVELPDAQRVWVIASVHGEAGRLARVHALLWERIRLGDRLVYLGNVIGHGPDSVDALDQVLAFRRAFMGLEPTAASHVALLRGSQEEMWQKLLQLHFATDPRGTLKWMLTQGVGATLQAYGSNSEEARRQAAAGTAGLSRWTQQLRQRLQTRPGHYAYFGALKRAALTEDRRLLFVNAGLDPTRPLEAQRDSFWWGSTGFQRLTEPYGNFTRVIRGFASVHPGLSLEAFTATLDAGCGFGGALLAAAFLPDGQVDEILEG